MSETEGLISGCRVTGMGLWPQASWSRGSALSARPFQAEGREGPGRMGRLQAQFHSPYIHSPHGLPWEGESGLIGPP